MSIGILDSSEIDLKQVPLFSVTHELVNLINLNGPRRDIPEGYFLWDSPVTPDGGSPLFPPNVFGRSNPRDLVVDFYGDAKNLKLQLEGKIGSLNVQYANEEPKVRITSGKFHDIAGHRQAEVDFDHTEWIVDDDWNRIFYINENVNKLTIRVHDNVDSIILSIPPGIGNLFIRIFGNVANFLPRRFRKGEPLEYKMSKMAHSRPEVSTPKPRSGNLTARLDIITRIAYSIFAIIRLLT